MTRSRMCVPAFLRGLLIALTIVSMASCQPNRNGYAQRLASGAPNAMEPETVRLGSLSPDSTIIFSSMRWKPNRSRFVSWELYVMTNEGTGVRRMTFGERSYQHAAVSPDWRYIAAVTVEGKGKGLWVYDLERKTERRLVPDFMAAGSGGVDWSPDGFIYFAGRVAKKDQGNIYKIRLDGTGLTQLTSTPEGEMDLSVSEDGKYVVFVRLVRRDRTLKTQIWRMNSDGTDQRMVYNGGSEWGFQHEWPIGAYDPEFSPDNRKVIFSRTNTQYDNFNQGAHDICVADADGGRVQVLTPAGAVQMIPDWKDDLILYTEFNEKEQFVGMVTMHSDGTNRRRVERPFKNIWDGGRQGKFIRDRDPAWSAFPPAAPAAQAASPASGSGPAEELIRDGAMEKGPDAWQLAPGPQGSDSRFWSEDYARDGSVVKSIRSTEKKSVYDFQRVDDPRLPGSRVVFSAWIRARKAGSRVTARLRWGGPQNGYVDLVEAPLQDEDWHHFSKTVEIPRSATEVAVACWVAGYSHGAFDDVSLKLDVPQAGYR